jgi:hypothetical protein
MVSSSCEIFQALPPGKVAPATIAAILYTQEMEKGSLGNDLLFQGPAPQVPSALEGLTTWFGMEQGVSPPLESPKEPFIPFSEGLTP